MRRVAILFVVLVVGLQPVYAFSPTFHAGISGGAGFFSWYASLEAGIKVNLRDDFALGLTQRVGYGFTYREIVGDGTSYLYVRRPLHPHRLYLVKPSSYAEPDFKTMVLPHLGPGCTFS